MFADALHVSKTGPVISFMPIILMGVLFGLAMDYEVFLVSRMREDYVHLRRARGGRADRATAISAVRLSQVLFSPPPRVERRDGPRRECCPWHENPSQ